MVDVDKNLYNDLLRIAGKIRYKKQCPEILVYFQKECKDPVRHCFNKSL
jgi:hypothetical protein